MRFTLDTDLPVIERDEWDGDAARERILSWAGYETDAEEDMRNEALERAARLFLFRRDESATQGDLVAPCGDIVDGEPRLITSGMRFALAAVNGARGGIDAPEELLQQARNALEKLLGEQEQEAETRSFDAKRDPGPDPDPQSSSLTRSFAVKVYEHEGKLYAEGYAVVFGGRDLHGEHFTRKTDFGSELLGINNPPLLYEHGIHPQVGLKVVGRVTEMKQDDIGMLVRAELDRHSEYIQLVRQLAEQGALGMSTGAPGHLVSRKSTGEIERWPIVEVSLTPTPAEPRTLGVEVVEAIRSIALPEAEPPAVVTADEGKADAQKGVAKEILMYVTETKSVTLRDFMSAVARKDVEAIKALGTGSGPSGGYLVPETLLPDLLTAISEQSIVLPRAFVTDAPGTVRQPVVDLSKGASGVFAWYGGIKFAWVNENSAIAETEPVFKQYTLRALTMAGIVRVSNRLLASTTFDAQLRRMLAESATNYLDHYFIRGSGAGEPLGVLNAQALVSVTRDTANQFKPVDAAKMLERLMPGSLGRAVWLIHPTVLPQLVQFSVGNTPVWQPNWQQGIAGTLMGIPVILTEKVNQLGTAGDVLLADFSMYAVQLVRDIEITASAEAYFEFDQTAYRVVVYADGTPRVVDKAKYINTNVEVSPFVRLQ
jgi:HK97 family phage major capsid protein/HK97 family phage prohead protease